MAFLENNKFQQNSSIVRPNIDSRQTTSYLKSKGAIKNLDNPLPKEEFYLKGLTNLVRELKEKRRRLTKKEKRLMKAAAKEIKRRQNIVEHYEREKKLFDLNIRKVCDKWEEILIKLRMEELNAEWLDHKNCVEHVLALKEKQATLLLTEFENIAHDRWMLSATYIEALDRLLNIGELVLKDEWSDYSKAINEKAMNMRKEIEVTNQREKKAFEHLQLIEFQQTGAAEQIDLSLKAGRDEALHDQQSTQWTDIDKMKVEVDNKLEWLLVEVAVRIQTYFIFTKPKRLAVQELRKKDDFFHELRDKDFRAIKLLKVKMKKLDMKLQEVEEGKVELREKKEEKERTLIRYKRLQRIQKEFAVDDKRKLKQLCVLSDRALQELGRKLAVFDRILHLKAQCKRYEYPEEQKTTKSTLYRLLTERSKMNQLNGFWEHIGKVELSVADLSKKVNTLEQEHKQLRHILYNHFKSYSFEEVQ